ncbi:MAG TPA: DegT/DnrJ/EryC1/StrS family aminotransferase [Bacteroidales bacterium]|nr:DegT/DnrJ/EryC1/StrS family aminotransferase [Bacteroidales bacterium]HOR60326.1 DegT/DnrJ/EryC1/StrS family aminotransferase [Bacteroidales bacterium]HPL04787.1 DegT/DnrJ/EryC1/StrS family aminotransferase [Bacteroidales bacterium]
MKIDFNKFSGFYSENKEKILLNLERVLNTGEYIRANEIQILETKISKLCNRKFALTTSSCTNAIFLALKTIDIKPGDEIILPSFSYIASLSPILMCNAKPVFVDISPKTLTLDFDLIKKAITPKTKAVIFVQLFGFTQDLSEIKSFLKEKNIILIEDAAQALGAKVNNLNGGEQGDLSCMSFDPTKIVSAFGTGGIVLTDNQEYYDKLTKLIHHGRNKNGEFEILGYNSKISELNASIINLQLENLDSILDKNNNIANQYFAELANNKSIKLLKPNLNQFSTYHKFVILTKNRNELRRYLYNNGIETKIHYSTLLHEQKLLNNFEFKAHNLQNSEYSKEKVLSLPIYPSLTKEKISYICNLINNY